MEARYERVERIGLGSIKRCPPSGNALMLLTPIYLLRLPFVDKDKEGGAVVGYICRSLWNTSWESKKRNCDL